MATTEQQISTMELLCAVCKSASNLKRCSRCHITCYCSREHQKSDWHRHKNVCNNMSMIGSAGHVSNAKTEHQSRIEPSETGTVNENPEQECQDRQNTQSTTSQSEIDSILDFSTISEPLKIIPKTKTEKQEIFFDLTKCDSQEYCGPSEDILDASYKHVVETLCPENAINFPENEEELDSVGSGVTVSNTQTIEEPEEPLFDPHPLRRLKFPKPETYELQDIVEFVYHRVDQLGYTVLDNAFDEQMIAGLISEIRDVHNNDGFRAGETLYNLRPSTSAYRNDMIKWVDRNEQGRCMTYCLAFIDSVIEQMEPKLKKLKTVKGRTDAMLACYPGNGAYYRRHVDNGSKDGRCLTCTLYLNKDWDVQRDGGLMRLFPPKHDKPVDVPPLAGRLLFFWSDERVPHEIHPAYRDRYSMTVWFYDAEEYQATKVEKLKQETDEIYNRIQDLEERRQQLREITASQQVRNRAMEAVRALTPGEIEALSLLIDHHPDPKAALTAMGISDVIQDALILHLNAQDNPG